jgi:hypothetical protein
MQSEIENWISVEERKPPIGKVVDTKVDRGSGVTNDQPLKFQGSLWFFPDGSMYVYYEPTHWKLQIHKLV